MKYKIKIPFKKLVETDNIAELLDDEQLNHVGQKVLAWYEIDLASRSEWEKKNKTALKLALQSMEIKSYPWQGASNIKFPAITIASLQFSARVYPSLIKAPDLAKYRVMGKDPNGQKAARAHRISSYISYQLLEENEQWEEEQDKLFIALPILGCVFKKTFYNPMTEKVESRLVMPQDLVINYFAKDLERTRACEQIPLYNREIRARQLKGIFIDKDLGPGPIPKEDEWSDRRQGINTPWADDGDEIPREFLECHCFWDFDGDGLDEPYTITVDKESGTPLRIKARFHKITTQQSLEVDRLRKENFLLMQAVPPPEAMAQMQDPMKKQELMGRLKQVEDKITANKQRMEELAEEKPKVISIEPKVHYTKYSFIPSPDGGYYDLGFGQLLGPLNESINTLINQLVDSGTLQNGSQGFIGKGARIQGGKVRFEPFEWKRVAVAGSTLKESLVPLPVNPPSTVLFQLLSLLIQYSERVSSVTETMAGENPGQNTPAFNMNAMLEQGLQVFNGVFKRIYRSFRSELRKIYILNGEFLDMEKYIETMDGDFRVLQSDFTGDPKDLIPAADPNAFSNMERMMKAQFLAQRSMSVPGYNPVRVESRLLEAMDIQDTQEVFPVTPEGSYGIPPPPNPELEIEKADMQRRTVEGKVRGEIDAAVAQADIQLKEAQAMQIMFEMENSGQEQQAERMKILLEQHKAQREEQKGKIDLQLKQMDLILKMMDVEIQEKKIEEAKAGGAPSDKPENKSKE